MSDLQSLIGDVESYLTLCGGTYSEAGAAEILLKDSLEMLIHFRGTMKNSVQQAINHFGWSDDIKVYPDYSGRGMSGKTTWGIVGDEYALDTFLEEWEDSLDMDNIDLLDDVQEFRQFKRVDNMAMDLIYY